MGHALASVCLFINYYELVCKDRKPWEGLWWGGWSREKAAQPEPGCAAASVRVRASACLFMLTKEGSAAGRVQCFPGASVSPPARRAPVITSPSGPMVQSCLPTLGRFQGTAALPSHPSGFCCIPVSHSPNKPLRAKERREQGRGRGEAGCKPSPASSLLPAPPGCPLPGTLVSQPLVPGELWNKSPVSLCHGLAV